VVIEHHIAKARMGKIDVTRQRKRHTPSEIADKLAMADDMAAQGHLHGDIAKSLGVSLMTYHRWREARLAHPASKPTTAAAPAANLAERERMSELRELRFENMRLRRLIADLLLEKDKLEERLRTGIGGRRVGP
jgi:putative transposase